MFSQQHWDSNPDLWLRAHATPKVAQAGPKVMQAGPKRLYD